MTTQISSNNIQAATLATLGSGPTVTNVQITDSSYNVLDDTAVGTSGGYIKITGSNFASGCSVIINSTNATSVTFVSSTVLNVQVPAMTAGTYIVYVVNTDGGIAIRVNGLTYSGTPSWVTGSTLPQGSVDSAISIQLSATSDSTITYALQAGSSLPTGLTLSSSGLLSGTITGLSAETTYNFTVTATDVELQDSPRTFSITITAGDPYWAYVTTLLSPTLPALPFIDDASTNNFAVTINGDTRPYNFNPYTPGYYSNYFDGTGDYLSVPSDTAFQLGTGDFTIEGWMFFTVSGVSNTLIDMRNGVTAAVGVVIYQGTDNTIRLYTGSADRITGSVLTVNNWYHIALSRSGTSTKLFVNGSQVGSTYTDSNNYILNAPNIGRFSDNTGGYMNGYISNLRIVKGTSLYTTTFTPPTAPLTAITNTSLLTCQSNRLIDNSTNAFTITKNGDTKVTSFTLYTPNSSYSNYGSTYFDGTGDYLSSPTSTATAFGTGDYTIEGWIYRSDSGVQRAIVDTRGADATGVLFYITSEKLNLFDSSTVYLTSTNTVPIFQWVHVAVTRSSGTTRLFINGIVNATLANDTRNNSTGASGCYIGRQFGSTANDFWGYMSNVRIVKGTAIYSSNFTPPTSPLTAITNTSLLTCQTNQPVANNTFIDNSTNNLAITRVGNTTQGTFSPYGENWSNYFDGSSSFASPTTHTIYASASQDFTFECWFNASSLATHNILLGWNQTPWDYISIRNTGYELNMAGSYTVAGTVTWTLNTWYHFAVSRVSNSVKVFINGQLSTTVTNSNSIGYGTVAAQVGNWFSTPTYYWKGYISNMRWIRGTGIYTNTFTPSTTPLTAISNTTLLTCASANGADNSPNNYTFTRTGSVTVQKFGPFPGTTLPTPYYGASFNGTSDYLNTATSSALTIGTNQFTVELWVYHKAAGASEQYLDSASSGFSLSKNTSNQLVLSQSGVSVIFTSTGTITAGQWNHIAIVRNASNVATMYINGTAGGTATVTTNFSNNYFYIGRQQAAAAAYLNGYVSNVRIVVGAAVYTANFTPPTSPLTAITNTQLLTCQSNSFIDNSSNNIVITSNGSVRPTTFNPFTVSYSTKQSYTPSVYGGSMYFGATSAYTTYSPASSDLFGTGDFTVECWVYTTVASVNICMASATASTWQLLTYLNQLYWQENGANLGGAGYGSVPLNAWTHLAVCRSGTTLRMFVNGVSVYAPTNSYNYSASPATRVVGPNAGGSAPYYLSDFRIVKGSALYTSNFVPENKPLAAVKNTTLLLNGTSAGIYDSSVNADVETGSPAKLSTAIVKFSGSTSMYFDGTGSSGLWMYNNTGVNFGAGDFTVEFWIYLAADATNTNYILDFRNTVQTTAAYLSQSGATNNFAWISGSNTQIGVVFSLTRDTWVNIAICRSGTTTRIFKDGVLSTSGTDTSSYSTSTLSVATRYTDGWKTVCYISDLRITKGYARYTANFTPPTSPFQAK